jgi:TonB family protein
MVSKLWQGPVKQLLSITAGIVAVALSAALYMYYVNPALTLSPEELHLRTVSPYYSGLPIGSVYPATKEASVQFKREAAYDVKKCAPKVLSSGRTPAQIHFREGEKPTGLIPVVAFQILESGEVVNIVLTQSSGIRDKDNAALDWVKRTKYNNRPGCGTVESEVGVTIDFAAR